MFVKLWMTTDIRTIAPEESIAEARRILEKYRIRRLPVVVEGALVGVVGSGDLEKAMPSILDADGQIEQEYLADHTQVGTVMKSSPVTISSESTLLEAAGRMRKNKIDGLPVVDGGKLVGIISVLDILEAFCEIMACDKKGTRLDLKIDHDPESFYALLNVFHQQNKEILAISKHHGYGKDAQLVTIHISDHDNDSLVDMLWAGKVAVERITTLS